VFGLVPAFREAENLLVIMVGNVQSSQACVAEKMALFNHLEDFLVSAALAKFLHPSLNDVPRKQDSEFVRRTGKRVPMLNCDADPAANSCRILKKCSVCIPLGGATDLVFDVLAGTGDVFLNLGMNIADGRYVRMRGRS
jgi:hypothetical protein